jgi:hypothetical protein
VTVLRVLLIALCAILVGHTGVVDSNHGMGLFNVFFRDMAAMGWPGQFNLDFMFMLALSALWVAWRHEFSIAGLVLGLLAFLGGSLFLTTYLCVLSWLTIGDMEQVLLGKRRVRVCPVMPPDRPRRTVGSGLERLLFKAADFRSGLRIQPVDATPGL